MDLTMFDYEVLDLGLVYYTNVIKEPQKIIDAVEELENRWLTDKPGPNQTSVKPWVPWTYGEGENMLTFNMQKFIPQVKDIPANDIYGEEQKFISSELFGALDITLDHYTKDLYPFAEKNIKSREHTMHLLKYEKTGHLPAHQDQGISTRVLSVLLYLNDDYEGGEIEFRHSDLVIKPDPGSVLFFPSNFLYVHEVHPVTKGPRYALPNWYHNVPLSAKRDSTGQE
jgi:Rps23 Pro-64 3,4-dihydroxylase Tpa1-like proline 4-hydroxylase